MSNSSDFQWFARVPLVLASRCQVNQSPNPSQSRLQSPTSLSQFCRVRPRYRAVVEGRCTVFLSPAQWLHVRCLAFRCKGRSFASKPFLRTGMAASPNQPISAGGDLETMCNCLLPPLRVHAIRERRRGREQTSVVYVKSVGWGGERRGKEGKEGQEKWRGGWLLDLGLLRRNVKRPRVGQSRGPLVWLRALFLLYLIPAIDNLLIACSICPARIYICICACLYLDEIIISLSPPFSRCIFPFSFVLVIQLLSAHWKVSAILHAPSLPHD